MTAPNGAILFNSTTGNGSDITASGLGAANVYGSGASTTGSSAVVTGIDTTGVSSGDLLWVQSSSGRQFSIIFTVDSSTQVTCDDVFANTESGRTWAIGGKRASISGSVASLDDWTADFKDDWTIQFESGYTETFTSRLRARTGGFFRIQSDPNAAIKPKLTTSSDFIFGAGSGFLVKGIEFLKSSSGGTLCGHGSGGAIVFSECKFGDSSNLPSLAFGVYANSIFDKCEFNASGEGIYSQVSDLVSSGCVFNGGSKGMEFAYPSTGYFITNCIFDGCTVGIYSGTSGGTQYYPKLIEGNIFKCVDAGIQIPANNSYRQRGMLCKSNIFLGSNYGIEFAASTIPTTSLYSLYDSNAFYNIGTSNYLNDDGNTFNDINLTADPFVDAANGNFQIDSNPGGGALLRANNYALNTDTSLYPFRQYVSDPFGGGGNVIVIEE